MTAPLLAVACLRCGTPAATGRQWTLTANAPAGWLSGNTRTDRRAETPDRQQWRRLGAALARHARVPRLELIHVLFTVHYPTGRAPFRDVGNAGPSAKAFVDGVRDAGVVADDTDTHVIGPDLRCGHRVPRRPYGPAGAVTVTITDLGGDPA